jgi:hypothetical protein
MTQVEGLSAERVGTVSGTRASFAPRARLLWVTGFALATAVLFLCYLRASMVQPVTSDGASNALQAWDMLHGNLLLHGWRLSDVSFYSTELPEYALVELVRGLGPADVHVAASLSYVLLVLFAGVLAKGRATGREGWVRLLIAIGIMVAPEAGKGSLIFLLSPDHTGTEVPMLLIWMLIDRGPRRWYVPVITGVALAWVAVADSIVLLVGVVPLAVVCGVRAYRGVVQRGEPPRDHWFELSLGGAALLSYPAASVALKMIHALGGFASVHPPNRLALSGLWGQHLELTGEGILGIFGADPTGRTLGLQTGLILLHLVGLALVAWALWSTIRRFFRCEDLLAQALAVAIVVNVVAYTFTALPISYWSTREIAGVLPLGAVLAGRTLAGRVIDAKLVPLLAVVALGYMLSLATLAVAPPEPAHDQALANWLTAHHLTAGLGSYAEGNSTTLDSHGAVQLRAPNWHHGRPTVPAYESNIAWFDPRTHDATFVVSTQQDAGFFIPYRWVTTAFGPPATTYHYGPWTIWVWNKNLLTDVR